MIVRQKAAVTLHQACASSNLYLHKIAVQQRQGYNSINHHMGISWEWDKHRVNCGNGDGNGKSLGWKWE